MMNSRRRHTLRVQGRDCVDGEEDSKAGSPVWLGKPPASASPAAAEPVYRVQMVVWPVAMSWSVMCVRMGWKAYSAYSDNGCADIVVGDVRADGSGPIRRVS